MVNKFAEELLAAAVTDIRVLVAGGTNGDVQRTRRTLVAHHQGFRQSAIPEIFLVTLYDIIPILIDSVLVVQINTLKTKIFLERKRIDFFDEIFLVDKVNAFCPI